MSVSRSGMIASGESSSVTVVSPLRVVSIRSTIGWLTAPITSVTAERGSEMPVQTSTTGWSAWAWAGAISAGIIAVSATEARATRRVSLLANLGVLAGMIFSS